MGWKFEDIRVLAVFGEVSPGVRIEMPLPSVEDDRKPCPAPAQQPQGSGDEDAGKGER